VLLDLIDLASEHSGLREGKLGDLLAAEPERAALHRETLRAYLDCSGNVASAAERLGVHPNTLRYGLHLRHHSRFATLGTDPDRELDALQAAGAVTTRD
jgi:sugar diacid utilization regulator